MKASNNDILDLAICYLSIIQTTSYQDYDNMCDDIQKMIDNLWNIKKAL